METGHEGRAAAERFYLGCVVAVGEGAERFRALVNEAGRAADVLALALRESGVDASAPVEAPGGPGSLPGLSANEASQLAEAWRKIASDLGLLVRIAGAEEARARSDNTEKKQ